VRTPQDKGECYLCCEPATTRDHIPPRGIFTQPYPNNLITVPACAKCNNGASKDDEYFRIAVAAGSCDSPESLAVLKQRILPKVGGKPALAISILNTVEKVDVYSEGGIYLGKAPTIKIDWPRIQNVINRIVRGLYWKHENERLPANSIVTDCFYKPKLSEAHQGVISQLPLYQIGNGNVFSYSYLIDEADRSHSFWYLMFYDDTSLFMVETIAGGPQQNKK